MFPLAVLAAGGSILSAYGSIQAGNAEAKAYGGKAAALRQRADELKKRADQNAQSAFQQGQLNIGSYANQFQGQGIKREGASYTGTLDELANRAQMEMNNIQREAQYEIDQSMQEASSMDTAGANAKKASRIQAASSLLSSGTNTYRAYKGY